MKKIAFIFPGQGSQYVGMGQDFYVQNAGSRKMYHLASQNSGLDVEELCFIENEKLCKTEYTQIAMLATELAIWKAVEDTGIKPDVTAGLSLGEYGALAVSGIVEPADLFRVIRQRGIYMQEAVPVGGAMTAVLGLPTEIVEQICERTAGMVGIANYNCPGQFVITGEEKIVAEVAQACLEAGAKRCIPLNVSGPFHSSLLIGAGEKLGKALEEIKIKDICVPYITNVTADYVRQKEEVKSLLIRQVSSSVKWQQSVERMIADGVNTFIEIGPGKTLTGFVRKINKDVTAVNIEKVEDLEKLNAI